MYKTLWSLLTKSLHTLQYYAIMHTKASYIDSWLKGKIIFRLHCSEIIKLWIVGSKLEGPNVCKDWFLYGKNLKMHISIRHGKNLKIAKCLSQLGMEKSKFNKMSISISYRKKRKILQTYIYFFPSKFQKTSKLQQQKYFWVEWKI